MALLCATPLIATEPEAAPVSLRIRVQTDEGVFLVYDAMIPPDNPRASPGYLAYWSDFASQSLYFYGELIQSRTDVGRSLLALERDMLIDLDKITEFSPTLAWMLDEAESEVPERVTIRGEADKTSRPQSRSREPSPALNAWQPLTYVGALAVMGFPVGGGVATVGNPPDETEVPCRPPAVSTKPIERRNVSDRSSGITRGVALPAPTAATPRQIITQAAALVPCIPGSGGGGGPPPPPPPPTPCPGDFDCDGIPNGSDPDVDGDGIPNGSDPDVDGDGIPNGNDGDIDGDGIRNSSDDDIDGDGIPNGSDGDDDGDGIPDVNDPEPGGCDADCPGACCNTTTGGCTIKKRAKCTAANERYQGNETKCSPNPCCPFGTNDAFPAGSVSIRWAPTNEPWNSACTGGETTRLQVLGEDVIVSTVCDGTQWCAVLTGLTGRYNQRVRLLPGMQEVTGPLGNTTEANFCNQVGELNTLGSCPGAWYMLAAAQAHEDVHKAHLLPSLQDVKGDIETAIEAICVPHTPGKTQSTAVREIREDQAFDITVMIARMLWIQKYGPKIVVDHAGPTDTAEHLVVDPMVSTICTHSKNQCWPVCATCPPRPTAVCCSPTTGTCAVETRCDCEKHQGVYRAGTTTCGPPNPCVGACCGPAPDRNCTLTTAFACLGPVFHYNGDGTVCSPKACDGPG